MLTDANNNMMKETHFRFVLMKGVDRVVVVHKSKTAGKHWTNSLYIHYVT